MPKEVQLVVAPPHQGDVSCIRLDSVAMEILQVKEGEKVLVTAIPRFGLPPGRQTRVRVVKAKAVDEGKGVVRLSSDIQDFSVGERVVVLKES
ncbi:MAG: hypothetical protein JTT11_06025 [Candidatus Brockarchaeota archaeon]|nr:hypothetical protein [Candidatus Brockarchaeota archaeon]